MKQFFYLFALAAACVSFGPVSIAAASTLAFGPDQNWYIIPFRRSEVRRYDGRTGDFIDVFALGDNNQFLFDLSFGPDGDLYVSDLKNVLRFDGTSGDFLGTFTFGVDNDPATGQPVGQLLDTTFGPDGNLYIVREHQGVHRHDGQTGEFIDVFVGHLTASDPAFAEFGPDNHLYVAEFLGGLNRYDGMSGQLPSRVHPHSHLALMTTYTSKQPTALKSMTEIHSNSLTYLPPSRLASHTASHLGRTAIYTSTAQ